MDREAERPPLKPSDVYRPRLGAQKEPLSKKTMAELRAWRAAKDGSGEQREQSA